MTQEFYFWIYTQKNLKAGSRKAICTPVFRAALFTIVKTWKQPKCSLADEWISKMQYI